MLCCQSSICLSDRCAFFQALLLSRQCSRCFTNTAATSYAGHHLREPLHVANIACTKDHLWCLWIRALS